MWESISDNKIFVNIQEGFTLKYRLCFHGKDIFAEDFLHKFNCVEHY